MIALMAALPNRSRAASGSPTLRASARINPLASADSVLLKKTLQRRPYLAPTAELGGNVVGDVSRPSFDGVEGDDADRVRVLTFNQAADHRRSIGIASSVSRHTLPNLPPKSSSTR
jgi:hypothetical protein